EPGQVEIQASVTIEYVIAPAGAEPRSGSRDTGRRERLGDPAPEERGARDPSPAERAERGSRAAPPPDRGERRDRWSDGLLPGRAFAAEERRRGPPPRPLRRL